MAKITEGLQFTGSLGDLSAYRLAGIKETIIRRKSGPSREKAKYAPAYANSRRNTAEFSDVNTITAGILQAIQGVKHLRDFNIAPALNGMARMVQQMDRVHPWGQRGCYFSQYGHMLEGFDLNKQFVFSSVVKPPLSCTIQRNTGTAIIQLPDLVDSMNLFLPWKAPLFRFVITLGTIDDRTWDNSEYHAVSPTDCTYAPDYYTDWYSRTRPFAAQTISLQLPHPEYIDDHKTILIAAGIETNEPATFSMTRAGRKTGCAKILKLG